MLKIQKLVFGGFQENTYVVTDGSGECVVVDPGCETAGERERLHSLIASEGLKPVMILLTHAHSDHVYGAAELSSSYGIPVMMDPRETETLEIFDRTLADMGFSLPQPFAYSPAAEGDLFRFGDTELRVLSTPGHSPGGLCFLCEADRTIFTGDTLFAGSIGRTDNGCASLDDLMASIHGKLMTLDGDITVHPGHGPSTTIATERTTNPFICDTDIIDNGDDGWQG